MIFQQCTPRQQCCKPIMASCGCGLEPNLRNSCQMPAIASSERKSYEVLKQRAFQPCMLQPFLSQVDFRILSDCPPLLFAYSTFIQFWSLMIWNKSIAWLTAQISDPSILKKKILDLRRKLFNCFVWGQKLCIAWYFGKCSDKSPFFFFSLLRTSVAFSPGDSEPEKTSALWSPFSFFKTHSDHLMLFHLICDTFSFQHSSFPLCVEPMQCMHPAIFCDLIIWLPFQLWYTLFVWPTKIHPPQPLFVLKVQMTIHVFDKLFSSTHQDLSSHLVDALTFSGNNGLHLL